MIKKHTYSVVKHGQKTASEIGVQVRYPDNLLGFISDRYAAWFEVWQEGLDSEDAPSDVETKRAERHAQLYAGFISAHHVQSAIKAAYGREPGKRTEDDKELIRSIEGGEILNGLDFVPGERQAKDDATVKRLKELDANGELVAKFAALHDRWGTEGDEIPTNLETSIALYRKFLARLAAAKKLDL